MGLLAISNQYVPQARYISRTHPHNKNAPSTLYQAESTQSSIFNFQFSTPHEVPHHSLGISCPRLVALRQWRPSCHISALTLSRNPVGVHVPEVQLKDEQLTVTPMGRYTLVRVEYLLYNNSKKDFSNLPYGFPIDYYRQGTERWASIDGISESVAEVGWRDDYINEVAFTLNGIQIPFQISADSLLKAGRPLLTPAEAAKDKNGDLFETRLDSIGYALYEYESDLLRRWYYTRLNIPAGYNIVLALEAGEMGFDEIQFDYIRTPEYIPNNAEMHNRYQESYSQAVIHFLNYAAEILHDHKMYLSADVFGETSGYDTKNARCFVSGYGQFWPAVSNAVDVISSMPYPDHFAPGAFGISAPWEDPGTLMLKWGQATKNCQDITYFPAKVRTWILAQNSATYGTVYDAAKITAQIDALEKAGVNDGYMTWNAASSPVKYKQYQKAFK